MDDKRRDMATPASPPPPPFDPDPDVIGHMENDERWLRRYVESARRAREAARTAGVAADASPASPLSPT